MAGIFRIFLFVTIAAKSIADDAETSEGSVIKPRIGAWFPVPFVTVAPTAAATTALLPYQTVALLEINSLRATHGVTPLTWDATLAAAAVTCANTHAAASSLTPPCPTNPANAAEEAGYNVNGPPQYQSQGVRAIMTDINGGWFGQQWGVNPSCIDFNAPALNANCSAYSQMIWASTTTVGCGYSTTTGNFPLTGGGTLAQFCMVCLFSPPGNTISTFAQNVFADTDGVAG